MNKNDLIEKYKRLKAPQPVREKIMSSMTEIPATEKKPAAKKWSKLKKSPAVICAAIMLSLVMVVSVVAVVISGRNIFLFSFNTPALFDSETIIYMPDVIDLGNNIVIESIIIHEENGENIFSMVISHSGTIKGNGYGFKVPEENYKSLEIEFKNGTSIMLDGEMSIGGGGGDGTVYDYFYQCNYEYKNFPNETEFTVKNNALGSSADIKLSKPKAVDELSVTDNGIKRINIFSAAGSSILSYNVEILRPTLLESDSLLYNKINYGIYGDITYKNGKTATFGTRFSASDGYKELTDYTDYPRYKFGDAYINNPEREKADKITINQITFSFTSFLSDGTVMPEFIYTIPLPELNERIEFETPYYFGTIGEFDIYFKAMEYKDGKLFIEMTEDEIKYNGFENVSNFNLMFRAVGANCGTGALFDGYTHKHEIPVGYSDSDTVDIELISLSYSINGLWEINFD
jgi:hypothetical protein